MTFEQILELTSSFSFVPVTCLQEEQDIFHFPDMPFLQTLSTLVLSQVKLTDQDVQCVFTDELLCFGIIKSKVNDALILLGPITSIPCDNQRAQQILRRYGLPSTRVGDVLSYFSDTPKYSLIKFANLLIYIHYVINRETCDLKDLLPSIYYVEEDSNPLPDQLTGPASPDSNVFHNSQTFERKLYSLIKLGKLNELNEFTSQVSYSGNEGILAMDMLRNYKNLIICSISLAARAAVEGGMDYESAMRQADYFMQKVELAPDLKNLSTLHNTMLRTYTRLVAVRKIGNPESTTAIKIYNFVEQNIHSRIRVQDIADALGLNRSYLCTQFKKETGLTLHDFISKARVDQAKLLLTTTDNSCINIASTLDFSSQSHFQAIRSEERRGGKECIYRLSPFN